MNKDKVQNQNILGTLVNKDESGIIAYSDQIYDKKSDRSLEEENVKQNERLDNVEAKDREFQSTLENITKTGEASAASNVTYNHNDSQLDASNVQQAIDEVRKRSNYNDGDNIIDFNTIHIITDNPEFVCVAVDVNEKILYGIKTDGQPYFGVGCPQQVKDYIDEQINKILGTNDITTTIDSLKEIEAFLKDFTNSDTLKALLDTKANKVDVVFDISAYHATGGTLATYDNLEDALGTNGENIPQSLKKGGMSVKFVQTSDNKYVQWRLMADSWSIDINNWSFCGDDVIVENPGWIRVVTDKDRRVLAGIKADGSIEWFVGIPTPIKKYIDGFLNNKVDKEEEKSLINEDYANGVTYVDNTEWIHAVIDSERRILEGLKTDGTKVFYKIDAKDVGENLLKVISDGARWKNKNIAYFGTSVPAQGYPQIVGAKLGANVYNQAIGSSMMRCGIPTKDYLNNNELGDDLGLGGVYFSNIMKSMSRTQKELRHIFDNWTDDRRKANLIAKGYTAEQVANVKGYSYYIGGSFPEEQSDPTTPQGWPSSKPVDVYAGDGETYKTFRQMAYSYCWDNSEDIESDLSMSGAITGTVKGRMQKFIDGEINTDLFVFDHFRNDCIDSTSSQYLEIPQNPLDRNYAEGAFNYLVSQILLVKPNAKIVIVGHIDNDDTKAQLGHVWEAQEIAANRWGFPLLKLWELLGIRCYRWVTTTGYWDNNGVWHDSGYNGSNHVWKSNNGLTAAQYENPRQVMINGVMTWVHDLTTRMIWLKDDVHPTGTLALNHFATIIASWLKTI